MAQQTVQGTVTDAGTGETLPGVNIVIEGTDRGTATGLDGTYELTVPSLDVSLVFSFIGYQRTVVPIDGRTTIDLELEMQVFGADDIVVVGYGTQRRETLTGSISSVSGRDLERVPVTNISNALAGQLPGIVSVNMSGEPGYDDATINIRGLHTLGNNQPLIVIDGVPGRAGGLSRLSSRDVESITVLKDASAAIYGSRAANGVILVTTKRGQVGAPQFNIDVNQGFNQPTRIPTMASAGQYVEMLNELDIYRDRPLSYSQQEIQDHYNCTDPWLNPCTDWFAEALKPMSYQSQANMSVSGGSETVRYFLSFGGLTEDGYYENSATRYNQYDFRSNIDGQLKENITLSLDLSGRFEERNFPTVGAQPTFRMLMRGKPHLPAYWPNGLPGPDIENGQNPVVTGTEATGYNQDERYFFQSNLRLVYEMPGIDGLSFTGNFSFDKYFRNDKLWSTPWTLYTWDYSSYDDAGNPVLTGAQRGPTEPQLRQIADDSQEIMLNFTANYQQDLENHSYSILVGTEQQRFGGNFFSGFRRGFISPQVDQLFAGGDDQRSVSGSAYQGARLNFFSRLNYAYQSKYLFEFIGRYDGSYIFPEDGRFGFFPAASVGWRLTQEDWFRNMTGFFDELKLRSSWGLTGNDRIGANEREAEWQYLASFGFGGGYVFDHTNTPSIFQTRTPNPDITWEVANQFDVGIEAEFLNNRFTVELDYFRYRRTEILHFRNASIPETAGFSLPRENIGRVASRGFDGSIAWREQFSPSFQLSVTLNGGYSENEILFWDEPPGAPAWQRSTGAPMFTNLYYRAIGVFQTQEEIDNYPSWDGARPGDIIFEDVNGDGVINADDRVRASNMGTPKWNGGLNISAVYRSFDFTALIQGAAGAVQYIQTESGDFGNYFGEFADQRWRPNPNDPTGMSPHPDYGRFEGPRAFQRTEEYWIANQNTFFLRNTDYLRLKQVEVGYNLPATITGRMGIQQLRVYANGFNLLTWDSFGLMDPEARNQAGQYYPQKRIVNLGLSLTF